MTKWTEEQQLAIDKEGQNIIVSAGAGSGKTAVLTERVIRKIKSGININNLLILTFTNKAAAEMKDRIRQALNKNNDLKNQLDYIDSSYITTFDSFSLSIVKKYSYLLNVSNNINIADSSIIYLETKKIIDDIFDRKYKEKNEDFLKLINDFTLKKDDDIKKHILDINRSLDLKYDKIEYLNNYLDTYYSSNNIDKLINDYNELLTSQVKDIDYLLTEFSYYVDSDFFTKFKEAFNNLFESKDYKSIKANIEVTLPRMPNGSSDEAKDTKEKIGKTILSIKKLVEFNDIDELKETLISTKPYAKTIIDIIKELDERLYEVKQELNIYDFIDVSKMGIKILKENKNICDELRDSFKEIMIDEYQDTSDLQEEFISLIANNNVYMVGDIKQSIYRFRNANPYLFKEKYDNYSNNKGGFKIDLTKNFRSRGEVINSINGLFSLIMTDLMGGADYKKTHQMIPGNDVYNGIAKTNQPNDLEIYNYEYDKTLGYSKEEIEIFFIAQDIKNKINNKYQIYDKRLDKLRDVQYKDFTILLDRSTNFDLYKKIFQYFSIPLTKNTATNITEENEIILIKNIIKLLINRKENNYDVEFNYAYTSIARSYLFEMNDQEVFDKVINKDYKSNLIDIIDSIVVDMDRLSLVELIYEIINKFDFYSKFILIGDINNRINRITSIIEIFDNLSGINYSIYDVYDYLNELIEDEYKIEVKEQDVIDNSVGIMTIHASKGLEFPICYYASLHSEFNKSDIKDRFLFNNKYGIITPYFKEGIGSTFVKELVKDQYNFEDKSEKIRLFYVALTRAREKMIIVTSFNEKRVFDIKKSNNFLDMLKYSKDYLGNYIKDFDVNDLNLTRDYNLIKQTNYKNLIKPCNDKINIKELEIDNSEINKEHISKETHTLLGKDVKEKMIFGTKMHEILELIDFKNPDYNLLDIDDYYKGKIKDFISQINIEKVKNIYKEYEFLYEENQNIYHGIIDLILEYDDSISIIDYKLKNVDDENYVKQLNSYKDYLSTKSNKKIDIYLFSIIDGTLNKI